MAGGIYFCSRFFFFFFFIREIYSFTPKILIIPQRLFFTWVVIWLALTSCY